MILLIKNKMCSEILKLGFSNNQIAIFFFTFMYIRRHHVDHNLFSDPHVHANKGLELGQMEINHSIKFYN